MFDLRSDTVTKPSKEVIESAITAELGDDEYIEDPTVNKLEEHCAELLNFEKGLFVSSGLMGNQISLLIHNDPGTEVITPHDSHIKNYEHGAAAFLSRVQFRDAQHKDGVLDLDYVEKLILKSKVHKPQIKTVSIENTHLASGGSIVSFDSIKSLSSKIKEYELNLHVDGARIFNAAVATGSTVADLTKNVDSVSFCLSKGLSAPSGSLLCGDKKFIHRARFNRKALGGGMRQAGILAAAGVVAIDIMSAKIIEDHRNAKALAVWIAKIDGIIIDTEKIKTNIIYFKLDHPKINSESLLNIMRKKTIRFFEWGPNWFRLVTHTGISNENIDYVISEFDSFFSQA